MMKTLSYRPLKEDRTPQFITVTHIFVNDEVLRTPSKLFHPTDTSKIAHESAKSSILLHVSIAWLTLD